MPDRRHAANAKARAKQQLERKKLTRAEYDRIVSKADRILKGSSD
jgi:heme oxygenase